MNLLLVTGIRTACGISLGAAVLAGEPKIDFAVVKPCAANGDPIAKCRGLHYCLQTCR